MIQKLSREEFARSLSTGTGRAYLHVQAYGLEGVSDLLMNACLHNVTYDPQCADSRAEWLLRMFWGTPQYQDVADQILLALDKAPQDDSYDLRQLCELVAEMALHGDEQAAVALRAKVYGQKFQPFHEKGRLDYPVGKDEIIKLDGVDAYIKLARQFGLLLLQEPQPYADEDLQWWDWGLQNTDLYEEQGTYIQQRLNLLAKDDAAIHAYVQCMNRLDAIAVEKKQAENELTPQLRQQKKREKILKRINLEKIINRGELVVGGFFTLSQWGCIATDEELQTVFQTLLTDADETYCERLLWVFNQAPLPSLHPRLWTFAHSPHLELRSTSQMILSEYKDPRIAALAKELITSTELTPDDDEVIALFKHNYVPGDEELILNALKRFNSADADNLHAMGGAVSDILENNTDTALCGLATWLYENTPCEVCRKNAVQWLCENDRLSPAMRTECQYDANCQIRELVWQ